MISKISIHLKITKTVRDEFLIPSMFKIKQTLAHEGEDTGARKALMWKCSSPAMLEKGHGLYLMGNKKRFFLCSVTLEKGGGHVRRKQARSIMGPRDTVGGRLCHHFAILSREAS